MQTQKRLCCMTVANLENTNVDLHRVWNHGQHLCKETWMVHKGGLLILEACMKKRHSLGTDVMADELVLMGTGAAAPQLLAF